MYIFSLFRCLYVCIETTNDTYKKSHEIHTNNCERKKYKNMHPVLTKSGDAVQDFRPVIRNNRRTVV